MKALSPLILFFLTLQCSAGVTDWYDFSLQGGHVKIAASISGIDTFAILDTGSQLHAINKSFVKKHDLSFHKGAQINVKGVFGTEKMTSYNNVPVNFFGIDTELDRMAEINFGHHTNGLLLGAGFFNQFVTQMDYPNNKIRLISHDSIDVGNFKNIQVQTQKSTGMPIVKVGLPNNKSLWLLLDTGNSGGMIIERKVAKSMGWLSTLETKSSIAMGATSIAQTDSFRIPFLKFGPFELENVLVSIPAEGTHANLVSQYQKTGSHIKGKKVKGIIGYDVLKHFLITIDYQNGNAHIGLPQE